MVEGLNSSLYDRMDIHYYTRRRNRKAEKRHRDSIAVANLFDLSKLPLDKLVEARLPSKQSDGLPVSLDLSFGSRRPIEPNCLL